MIDKELLALVNKAKEKENYLQVSHKDLVKLILCSLSFDSERFSEEIIEKVLANNNEGIDEAISQVIHNQNDAFLLSFEMARNNEEMDESKLKDLHQILMRGFSNIGGLYRNVDISLNYSNHTPPSHIKVYDRMKKYFIFTNEGVKGDLFEFIAYSHLQLAKIHPFLDGNGRLARLVLNYQLMKNSFRPVLIPKEKRNQYFDYLEEFKVNKNITPFVNFLKELELEALKSFLAI